MSFTRNTFHLSLKRPSLYGLFFKEHLPLTVFMDLEANMKPTNEIQKDLFRRPSIGQQQQQQQQQQNVNEADETDVEQTLKKETNDQQPIISYSIIYSADHEVQLAYLISLASFFCFIFCPMMIYHEYDHYKVIIWIAQALGLLSVWSLWLATHQDNDPSQEFHYFTNFTLTFSLMLIICFFHLLNKKIPLSHSVITGIPIPIPIPLWFCLIPVVQIMSSLTCWALLVIYYDGYNPSMFEAMYNFKLAMEETSCACLIPPENAVEEMSSHERRCTIIIFSFFIFTYIFYL